MDRRTIEKRRSRTTSSSPMKDMYEESFDMYKEMYTESFDMYKEMYTESFDMYKDMYTESCDEPDRSLWTKVSYRNGERKIDEIDSRVSRSTK